MPSQLRTRQTPHLNHPTTLYVPFVLTAGWSTIKITSAMLRALRNSSTSSLVGVAILVGVLVGFGLSTVGYSAKFQFLSQSLPALNTLSEEVVWYHDATPHSSQSSLTAAHELQYLSDMVAKTNGFYARDYSLWLGWNNVCGSRNFYRRVLITMIDALYPRNSNPPWSNTKPNNYNTFLCIRSCMRVRLVRLHFSITHLLCSERCTRQGDVHCVRHDGEPW